MIKTILKNIIPPIFLRIIKRKPRYGFFGDYSSWREALKLTGSYDSEKIFEKVKNASLKVKHGEAVYERDSVLFDKIQYSWPLLTSLLWIASKQENRLNLIDFGGALGTSYYQNLNFLSHLRELKWNIVEQKKFVDYGKELFAGQNLNFYYSIKECLKQEKTNVLILSNVIQYLEFPYQFLENIGDNFEYVIIDRTPVFQNHDQIVIQKIPPRIYEASYPCWILNDEKIKSFFSKSYELIADFDADIGIAMKPGNSRATYKGFLFKRRNNE